jgi:biotin carboxyl carrier protein
MTMENELHVARDGTIGEIRVREGATVEAGALLFVIT